MTPPSTWMSPLALFRQRELKSPLSATSPLMDSARTQPVRSSPWISPLALFSSIIPQAARLTWMSPLVARTIRLWAVRWSSMPISPAVAVTFTCSQHFLGRYTWNRAEVNTPRPKRNTLDTVFLWRMVSRPLSSSRISSLPTSPSTTTSALGSFWVSRTTSPLSSSTLICEAPAAEPATVTAPS